MSPRTVFAVIAPVACAALFACGSSEDGDDAPVADEATSAGTSFTAPPPPTPAASSSPAPQPQPSSSSAPAPAPASTDAGASDASADAAPAPPQYDCAAQTMWDGAKPTSCAAAEYTLSGGTPSLGRYYLAQWANTATKCTSTAQRKGTMSIEEVDGVKYMRWIFSNDGKTATGSYRFAPIDATTLSRQLMCTKVALTTNTTSAVSYSATANEIVFVHDGGQERWVRIPKVSTLPTLPTDPIFTQ